ncbi:MAG: glycosyltransferase [Anaerolineales bacterium]|nr:glycosyltransferase [Anaerolineales bacterium]
MNDQPLVSIVTPSLNQSKFIQATIESILSQDYPNLEYWVIDGGSNDGTIEILKSYGERIHWLSEPDDGQSQAVNKGWRLAKGNILGWVNADDLLKPFAVRNAVEALLATPSIGAVYGRTNYIDEQGKFIQNYPVQSFNYEAFVRDTENFIPQPSVFTHRNVLERTGFLNEKLHYVMDYDLWLRIGLTASMKYLPVEMAALRLHSAAKTVSAMSKFAGEFISIYEDLFSNSAILSTLQQDQNTIMQTVYIHSASFCFWGGETQTALSYLLKAWQLPPFPRRRAFWLLFAFSIFGKTGWKLAEYLHGNPMQLKKGVITR